MAPAANGHATETPPSSAPGIAAPERPAGAARRHGLGPHTLQHCPPRAAPHPEAGVRAEDPRLREVLTRLVAHLRAFVREVELTDAELYAATRFLYDAGRISDERRQELILLSDTLGVTMLVDAIGHRVGQGISESSVLGPFYRDGAPVLEPPVDIARGVDDGEPLFVSGRVAAPDGTPQPEMNLEGDPCLDSDALFAVKDSLVVAVYRHATAGAVPGGPPSEAAPGDFNRPVYTAHSDFGLEPAGAAVAEASEPPMSLAEST